MKRRAAKGASAFRAMSFWGDAGAVIALRTAQMMAGGPAVPGEMALMVTEKLRAASVLQQALVRAGPGVTPARAAAMALTVFGPKVRANRKRLLRAK